MGQFLTAVDTKGKVERMVHYVKHHFFVRYRRFDSWSHLNQLLEQWLREEADLRVHGTHGEQVKLRFERDEQAVLKPLAAVRWDSSYYETRYANWDGYVDVRGNRYSVPSEYTGQHVSVRISLDGRIRIHNAEDHLIAEHRQVAASEGWQTVPEHHQGLWKQTLDVQRRDLRVYEEAGTWS